jgi:hypothetical protein
LACDPSFIHPVETPDQALAIFPSTFFSGRAFVLLFPLSSSFSFHHPFLLPAFPLSSFQLKEKKKKSAAASCVNLTLVVRKNDAPTAVPAQKNTLEKKP